MDESITEEEALETNWVFVEDIDIAEEALDLTFSKGELVSGEDESSQESFEKLPKKIKKSFSDSHLVNQENDNYLSKGYDKQIADLDSESDGLSIISNWSYSQGTPDGENLEDGIDNKENEGNQTGANDENENDLEEDSAIFTFKANFTGEIDEIPNLGDDKQQYPAEDSQTGFEDDYNYKHEEESKDNIQSDIEGLEKDEGEFHENNEVNEKQEEPVELPEKSFPTLSEDRILQNEHDLLDQLRWLDEPPESIEDSLYEQTIPKYMISKIPQCIKKHFSVSGFLIGTVLIAASSVFLGRYFTATKPIQEELPTYKENVFLYDVPNEDNFEVPTALSFCREKHKSDDIYMEINAQKCLSKIEKRLKRKKQDKIARENIKFWEKKLEIKEQYLTEKERNLMKKEADFVSKEKNRQTTMEFQNKYQTNYNKDDPKDKQHKHDDKKLKMKGQHKNHQKLFNEDSKEKMYKQDGRKRDKFKIDDVKYVSRERINMEDDIKRDYYKNGANIKENKHRMKTNDFKVSPFEYKKKQDESSGEKLAKNWKKKYANRSEFDGFCRNSKSECKNSKNKYKQKHFPNFVLLDKKNETLDGSWLGRLFKGREELRNKDKLGEWYFDRSSYRKRKRDKSGWYFDWMMDRELLRYRRLYLNI